MGSSGELELVVKGGEEAVLATLEEVPGAELLERVNVEGLNEGCVKVRMISARDVDIREDVFYALAQSHLPIMEMHYAEKSLEDIFLELTEKEVSENVGNL